MPGPNAHLLSLLAIVARGLEYTDRYDFAKPCSDYESQVAEHRKSLFTVVRDQGSACGAITCAKSRRGQTMPGDAAFVFQQSHT